MYTDCELREALDQMSTGDLSKVVTNFLDLTDQQHEAIKYISVLILCIDSKLSGLIVDSARKVSSDEKVTRILDIAIDELTLSGKLNVLKETGPNFYKTHRELWSFCRKINDIRNRLFHVKRIFEIKYKEQSIFELSTQRQMTHDFRNAFLSDEELKKINNS